MNDQDTQQNFLNDENTQKKKCQYDQNISATSKIIKIPPKLPK